MRMEFRRSEDGYVCRTHNHVGESTGIIELRIIDFCDEIVDAEARLFTRYINISKTERKEIETYIIREALKIINGMKKDELPDKLEIELKHTLVEKLF